MGMKAFKQGLQACSSAAFIFSRAKNYVHFMQIYLKTRKFKAATHADLWSAMVKACIFNNVTGWDKSPLNVSLFMNSWILQSTFPLLTVSSFPNGTAVISQSAFLERGNISALPPSPWGYQWYIPVWHRTMLSGTNLEWLQPGRQSILSYTIIKHIGICIKRAWPGNPHSIWPQKAMLPWDIEKRSRKLVISRDFWLEFVFE